MNQMQINIHCKQLEDQNFFIYAKSGRKKINLITFTSTFFQWHDESYYGSKLKPVEVDGKVGYVLTPYMWMGILAKQQYSSFVKWEWDELSLACSLLADELFKELEATQNTQRFLPINSIKIPEKIVQKFPTEFWKQVIKSKPAKTKKSVEHIATEWFRSTMAASPLYRKQNTFASKLQEKGLSISQIQDFFGISNMDSDVASRPFTLGVRLVEPNFDLDETSDDWKMIVFLRDRNITSRTFEWSSRLKAPSEWHEHFIDVEQEIDSWSMLFPWLDETLSEHLAWQFLTEVAEVLYLLDIEVLLPAWWKTIQNAKVKVKAKVSKNSETFVGLNALINFNWQLSIGDKQLSAEEFQKLVDDNRKLIYIQGKWVRLDENFMQRIQEMMKQAEDKGLTLYDFLQNDLPQSEDENDEGEYVKIQFEVNNALDKFVHQLKNYSEIPLLPVPESFQGKLRPYQVQGMSWLLFLREHRLGACLADDMGLGKTIQIICYLLYLQEREELDTPSLIVCPTSVLGNWQNELAKFSPSLKIDLHYGSGRKQGEDFHKAYQGKQIILTSYGILHQDEELFHSVEWNAIVLDEAQNIKNASTKQSRTARKLRGKHHISATGTPIENRLSELWAIFDFTIKGYLGTASNFDKTFSVPIEKNGDARKKVQLQKLIQPFLLRRSKKDEEIALDLPDKLEQKEFVPLSTEQAVHYQNIVQDTMEKISRSEGFERKGLVLKMLLKLKQVCNHPALFLKEEYSEDILNRSGKMEKLAELLDVILEKNENVLIFTQFLGMGELIQQLIRERYEINVPFLQGSTTKKKRDQMVADFQNGEFPILLLSLKAGGTGLNLTAANHVIHFDRWWNPAVENQATDRAYRIGQKKFVHVHKLITTGTLEERIDLMLEKKQTLNEEIIQSDNWITELSTSELHELLALTVK